MNIQIKVESEGYETALDEYLNEGINYSANTIQNADVDDLQQLASDSFFYGAKYKNDELSTIILDVLSAIENNTAIEYGGFLHKRIGEFVSKNGIVNSLPL